LVPVADAKSLKAALTAALGICGRVRKRRDIYLWHNVRIHLDRVDGLGSFIEFEAVLGPADDLETACCRLAELKKVLGISPMDHLAEAYADLLKAATPTEHG
jgi:predicted adenylyl cyclase CyaB